MTTALRTIDKSTWPVGPWQDEPDEVRFDHVGLKCQILRHETLGHLCGYVIVPNDHVGSEKHYRDVPFEFQDVNGGLTFAMKVDGEWTFGFDCNHLNDYAPGTAAILERSGYNDERGMYWTIDMVRGQVQRLANMMNKWHSSSGA